MLETANLIKTATHDARELDAMLLNGRKRIVRQNLSTINGRQRSDRHVERLAGHSPDVYRKSASERWIEWYGSVAIEDPVKSQLVGEFLRPLLSYAKPQTIFIDRDFWQIDEDIAALFAQVRKAVVTCDQMKARLYAVQVKCKVEEMLDAINRMPTF